MSASYSAATQLLDFYERIYRPARHPADGRSATHTQFRVQIANLNRYFREQLVAAGQPPRDVTLGDLSDELVTGCMDWQVGRGRERTTANKIRAQINPLWRMAARKLVDLPRPDNEKYRVDLAAPVAFLPDEFERILQAAARRTGKIGPQLAGSWWVMAILFIFSTGLRIGAAWHVPTKNVDLVRGEVLVRARTQKQRRDQRRDLVPSAVDAIKRSRITERSVPTVLGDYAWKVATFRRHFAQILVEADIGYKTVEDVPRQLKLHALRKTLASQVAAKAGIHVACDILDHSSTSVTKRYVDDRYTPQPRVRDLIADPLDPTNPPTKPELRVFREEAG